MDYSTHHIQDIVVSSISSVVVQWRADGSCSDTRPSQACCPSGDDGGSLNVSLGQTCYSQFLDPHSFLLSFLFVSHLASLRYLAIFYDTSQGRERGRCPLFLVLPCRGPWA